VVRVTIYDRDIDLGYLVTEVGLTSPRSVRATSQHCASREVHSASTAARSVAMDARRARRSRSFSAASTTPRGEIRVAAAAAAAEAEEEREEEEGPAPGLVEGVSEGPAPPATLCRCAGGTSSSSSSAGACMVLSVRAPTRPRQTTVGKLRVREGKSSGFDSRR